MRNLHTRSITTAVAALTALCLALLTQAPSVRADESADVATMASIVLSLQHFPSAQDKETLAAIAAGDSSDSVKAVANAIAGIQHKVSDADKATLMAIAGDENEPADLRQLAGIVANLNHVPGAEAKAELETLVGG